MSWLWCLPLLRLHLARSEDAAAGFVHSPPAVATRCQCSTLFIKPVSHWSKSKPGRGAQSTLQSDIRIHTALFPFSSDFYFTIALRELHQTDEVRFFIKTKPLGWWNVPYKSRLFCLWVEFVKLSFACISYEIRPVVTNSWAIKYRQSCCCLFPVHRGWIHPGKVITGHTHLPKGQFTASNWPKHACF